MIPAATPNHALLRLEQFGKLRKEFAGGKGFVDCETETAGAVESTAPRPSRCGCNPRVPRARSISLGRWPA
jgi:hypothetical protein